jgi:hypothetical protein
MFNMSLYFCQELEYAWSYAVWYITFLEETNAF